MLRDINWRIRIPALSLTPDSVIRVAGVPEYIAQLLDKLIANAVEFTFPDKPILIDCRALRDHAVIRVSNARPITAGRNERPFIRFDDLGAPTGKTAPAAPWHGAAYCRLISDFHGGQIRAENRQDQEGVTITVVIPLFYK